jgi:branched-chain amino acid transport system ATP-binding protein
MTLLSVHGLKVHYGGIHAVRGINFEVAEGELVCLIGANGAGKSSTLKGLMGLVAHSGDIRFDGTRLSRAATHAIVARGLAMVPEGRGIFGRLTGAENLDMGAYLRNDRAGIKADLARAYDHFPRLAERRSQFAGTLSGGEQQMLAIARAMMGRPRLLLLDEPSMGLAPLMVQKIYQAIATIASEGVTIFLVEQNANLALQVSHRAYVLESGEITLSGASADLANNPQVRAAYLGD